MSCYEIMKSPPLSGTIQIQGSKNSVLPIMAAAVLVHGVTVLHNCPDITDVANTITILKSLGCKVERSGSDILIDASKITSCCISEEDSGKLRSSFLFMGPVIARCKKAVIAMPGGCKIGERPIDLHLDAFRKMGVLVRQTDKICADGSNLLDAYIRLAFPSVGATENVLLLAAASGRKVILDNSAREPEIIELCRCLNGMGADITGAGSSRIVIHGVKELKPTQQRICGDRICAGTYIAAVGICGGDITIGGISPFALSGISQVVGRMGIRLSEVPGGIRVQCRETPENVSVIETGPFPEFPTDMQSPLLALSCVARGNLEMREKIFENRFQIVPELIQMGADIKVLENRVLVKGGKKLTGCEVEAKELRGGAALVIAGLAAEGTTKVYGTRYIKRGYENMMGNLISLGAFVREMEE